MELHDKGTDRVLTALGVKPEGTPTPSPRAHVWELTGSHPQHANGAKITIMGRATRFECRMELDRRRRQGWTNLQVGPQKAAPLAILGPGGDYTREIR